MNTFDPTRHDARAHEKIMEHYRQAFNAWLRASRPDAGPVALAMAQAAHEVNRMLDYEIAADVALWMAESLDGPDDERARTKRAAYDRAYRAKKAARSA